MRLRRSHSCRSIWHDYQQDRERVRENNSFCLSSSSWLYKKKCRVVCLMLILSSLYFASVNASSLSDGPWGPTDPVADPNAMVIVTAPFSATTLSTVRFTVLTDRVIRIERGPGEDRKTLAVINRKLPVPYFQHWKSDNGRVFYIQTKCLTLMYEIGTEFASDTLQIQGQMYCYDHFNSSNSNSSKDTPLWSYHYGDQDPGNLLGTIRTLDNKRAETLDCSRQTDEAHCEYGLISRSGYAIVNDTLNYALDNTEDWWDRPNRNQEDLYFFGHGHDYKAALQDYRQIGGYIPQLPRYALGVWFSRWYDYTPASAAKVVQQFEQYTLPLDVFVLDMNWHTKNDWTGYSFDRRLFQTSRDAVAYLKARGLAVTLNLHDANGVNPWEEKYSDMCRAMKSCTDGERIEFSIVNQTTMYALEDVVLQPLEEKDGVDFWWIDWQQGEEGPGGAAGGKQNPTIWTAHVRSTDANRRRQQVHATATSSNNIRRSMVLARWGGLGAHRYPVHFSGDVDGLTWSNLAYQPYFSMTATNVGAIWSHDIGGPSMDPELVTRWIQWGVVSGIMRFHDRGLSAGDCAKNDPPSCSVVTPWDVAPKYAQANFEALRLRGSMVPYLYTAAFNAHRNGRWFIAPMYYEWPEMESAYQTASPRPDLDAKYDSQYLLGDDLLVAPVVKSANATDDLARMNVWVPPGLWVGLTGGRVLEGDVDGSTSITLLADINEIPIYARAGSIIPSTPIRPGNTIGRARKPYDELVWTVYLAQGGPDSGSGIVYEDDGYSTRYDTVKDYAITTAQYKISDSSGGYGLSQMTEQFRRRVRKSTTPTITLVFTVSTSGRLQKEMCRATTIRFMNTFPPHSVVSNGKELPFSQFGGKDTWHFESVNAALVIELSHADVSKGVNLVVEMQSSPGDNKLILDGFGFQIARAEAAKAALDEIRITPGSRTGQDKAPGNLLLTTSLGSLLEYLAGIPSFASFEAAVRTYPKQLGSAFEEVQQLAHCQNTATISDIGQAGESDTRSLDRVARAISLLQEASSAGTQ